MKQVDILFAKITSKRTKWENLKEGVRLSHNMINNNLHHGEEGG